jgi:hypothetical protein
MKHNDNPVTVIPAQPGYDAVSPVTTGDQVTGLYFTPIVAWAVEWGRDVEGEFYHIAHAVCMDIDADVEVIRTPTGRIIFLSGREAASEERRHRGIQRSAQAGA